MAISDMVRWARSSSRLDGECRGLCLHVLYDIFVFIVACIVSFECFDDTQVFVNCCDVVFELFERVEDCALDMYTACLHSSLDCLIGES